MSAAHMLLSIMAMVIHHSKKEKERHLEKELDMDRSMKGIKYDLSI